MLAQEWLIGLGALLLGSGMVLLARWRRRSPGHAAK
jgi:LPXTG-motif cell wall-anchored protein